MNHPYFTCCGCKTPYSFEELEALRFVGYQKFATRDYALFSCREPCLSTFSVPASTYEAAKEIYNFGKKGEQK